MSIAPASEPLETGEDGIVSQPLPVSAAELRALDMAIESMARVGKRQQFTCVSLIGVRNGNDAELCKRADELISNTLTSLKREGIDEVAEKLFERLIKVIDKWGDPEEQLILGVVYMRFIDTMQYLIAFKRKFRGLDRGSCISKNDALDELRLRGLTAKKR